MVSLSSMASFLLQMACHDDLHVFICPCSGSPVVVNVKLEREDEESVAPHVIAPFFPQVGVACWYFFFIVEAS